MFLSTLALLHQTLFFVFPSHFCADATRKSSPKQFQPAFYPCESRCLRPDLLPMTPYSTRVRREIWKWPWTVLVPYKQGTASIARAGRNTTTQGLKTGRQTSKTISLSLMAFELFFPNWIIKSTRGHKRTEGRTSGKVETEQLPDNGYRWRSCQPPTRSRSSSTLS